MTGTSLSGHQRPNAGLSDDWLTPPEIIEALGPFDLDPCALFLRGRPHFHYPDGRRAPFNSGAPIVLLAYGAVAWHRLHSSSLAGHRVWL